MTEQDDQPPRRARRLVIEEAVSASGPAPDAEEAELGPSPQDAPPPPDAAAAWKAGTTERSARRSWGWLRLFFAAVGLAASISIALWADALYRDAVAASPILGYVVLALLGAILFAGLVLVGRELAAIGRIRRIGDVRSLAERALAPEASARDARRAADALARLYRGRRDLEWSHGAFWRGVADRANDQADPAARLVLYEREVVARLDAMAQAEIERAARRVTAATTLMPSALLDAIAALVVNVTMIRRIAEIYGGRGGFFGSIGLARRVVAHAMAAGLIEMGGDMLAPLLGGGVAAGASRRLGEGLINGAMTVRIGLAAADLCRPTPYHAVARPSLRAVSWSALRGVASVKSKA